MSNPILNEQWDGSILSWILWHVSVLPFGLHELIYYIYQLAVPFYSIAVPREFLDLGFEKKLFSQALCFSPCTATPIDTYCDIDRSNSFKFIKVNKSVNVA